jgi:hypothetical protein
VSKKQPGKKPKGAIYSKSAAAQRGGEERR